MTLARTLKFQLRFLLPLTVAVMLAAGLAVPLVDQVTLRWFSRDLNSRGTLVAHALTENIGTALSTNDPDRLQPLLGRAAQDERLVALGLCGLDGQLLQATELFPRHLSCPHFVELAQQDKPHLALTGGAVHVGVQDILGPPALVQDTGRDTEVLLARLVLLHDMSFIERRPARFKGR